MNKLLCLILLSFLFISCSTWQKEFVSSTYRCTPTGEIEKNQHKFPLGRDVNIIENELKEVLQVVEDKEKDEEAFELKVTWTYTSDTFSDYQNSAILDFVHDGKKLQLVELK